MAPCWTALKYFQYPAGRFILLRLFLFLLVSIIPPLFPLSSPLVLLLWSAVASFQSSFMPPGGEDLITRGEWILLPSLSIQLGFLFLTRLSARAIQTPSARISPSFLFFSSSSSSSFSFFSKVAVSRKPGRSLGFRGLCSNSASWWSKTSLLDHDAVSKTERATVLVRVIRF